MSDQTNLDLFLDTVSRLCGWLYVLCWSLSFYPQPLQNLRRRTTSGLTPDFPLLNVVGFTCYTSSTALFLFSRTIRAQYAARHPYAPEPTVRGNDFAFGLHAVVLVIITYSQFYPRLWGWKDDERVERRKITRVSAGLVWGCAVGILVTAAAVLFSGNGDGKRVEAGGGWEWLDVVYAISYVKLLLTIFKYIPQAVANHRRRSTVGWSIGQVLLDFAGGILSLVQLVLDSAREADWSGLTGNPAKFGLANISLLFDFIFIVQHYVLYPQREDVGKEVAKGKGFSSAECSNEESLSLGRQGERTPLLHTARHDRAVEGEV